MIIKQKVVEALNMQLISEFSASSQYTAIAVYFDEKALPELSNYFLNQSEEERMHAMKIIHFMLDAGAKPIIPALPEVMNDFDSAEKAVELAFNQELKVTDEINNLVALSLEEGDHTTNQFLQWFVTEQVEEVSTIGQLLQTIKHAGNNLLLVEDYVRRNPQHAGADGGA
jgi:ferritin